jgi:hypothetical protein
MFSNPAFQLFRKQAPSTQHARILYESLLLSYSFLFLFFPKVSSFLDQKKCFTLQTPLFLPKKEPNNANDMKDGTLCLCTRNNNTRMCSVHSVLNLSIRLTVIYTKRVQYMFIHLIITHCKSIRCHSSLL